MFFVVFLKKVFFCLVDISWNGPLAWNLTFLCSQQIHSIQIIHVPTLRVQIKEAPCLFNPGLNYHPTLLNWNTFSLLFITYFHPPLLLKCHIFSGHLSYSDTSFIWNPRVCCVLSCPISKIYSIQSCMVVLAVVAVQK